MIIDIIQVVSAVILVIAILMQNRGAGLGSAFGGGGDGVYQTRRSAEKFIFNLTIVVAVIFFATAVINILQ